jgi:hypothetical protein
MSNDSSLWVGLWKQSTLSIACDEHRCRGANKRCDWTHMLKFCVKELGLGALKCIVPSKHAQASMKLNLHTSPIGTKKKLILVPKKQGQTNLLPSWTQALTLSSTSTGGILVESWAYVLATSYCRWLARSLVGLALFQDPLCWPRLTWQGNCV